MSYLTTYAIDEKGNKNATSQSDVCFSNLFYDRYHMNKDMNCIRIYVPLMKKYQNIHCDFRPADDDVILWWMNKMGEMGIYCSIQKFEDLHEKIEYLKGPGFEIKWKPTKKNWKLIKFVATMVRYCYESDFSKHITAIYNKDEDITIPDLITKLHDDGNSDGHSLFSEYHDGRVINRIEEIANIIDNYNYYEDKKSPSNKMVQMVLKTKCKNKIFIPGGQRYGTQCYGTWLQSHMDCSFVNNLKDADLVIFTGGEDVTPSLYGEEKHYTTYNSEIRDAEEKILFDEAVKAKKRILGICRGSQFITVMNGGKLIQNVSNHCGSHKITVNFNQFKNKKITVSSTHHQMMYPYNLMPFEYEVIAWADGLSDKYDGLEDVSMMKGKEPEIVLYPKTKCLAIQSHPEIMDVDENQKVIADIVHWFLYE